MPFPGLTSDDQDSDQERSGDDLAGLVLEDTHDTVTDSRDTHGDAVENQQHIAQAWTWYLRGHGILAEGERVTGADVARLMQLVKMSRGAVGEYDIDHDRDSVGYGAIAAACEISAGAADIEEVLPDE